MKSRALRFKKWEVQRLLHDECIPLLTGSLAWDREIDRRIDLGVSGPPIQVLLAYGACPSPALEKAMAGRRIFFSPVSDSEYSEVESSTEPDFEYLQNYRRGKAANLNGAAGEKGFRDWCKAQGFISLKTKYLSAHLGRHPIRGDKKFWVEFRSCARKISKRSLAAIKEYMRGRKVGLYGEVAGMADYLVIAGRKQFFVEVKSRRSLKFSSVQQAASGYFYARGMRTHVWRADSGEFDEAAAVSGNLTTRLSRRRQPLRSSNSRRGSAARYAGGLARTETIKCAS